MWIINNVLTGGSYVAFSHLGSPDIVIQELDFTVFLFVQYFVAQFFSTHVPF